MVFNLSTLRGTPAYVAAKFANGLSAGVLTSGLVNLPDGALSSTGADGGDLTNGTIEGWVYVPAAMNSLRVWAGHDYWYWIGFDATLHPTARYGTGDEVNLTAASAVTGDAWHHVALVISAGAGSLYVDGARVATSASTRTAGTSYAGFAVGGFGPSGNASFDYPSLVDEVRVSSTARYTGTTYDTPTAAFTSDADTLALYHLENATDSNTDTGTIAPNNANLVYSPYNWDVNSTRARTINSGAYFRALITATAITLNFDVTSLLTPIPQLAYRVDGGAWVTQEIAATIDLTLPTTNTWAKHMVEVVVKSTTEERTRWTGDATSVRFTGFTVPAGGASVAMQARTGPVGIIYGDSITEGVRTMRATAPSGADTDRNDATQGWAWALGDALGSEVGVVGFGAQGWASGGNGSVPVFGTSWDLLWDGLARTFTPEPEFVVINQGTNAAPTQAQVEAVLNDMDANIAAGVPILVLRPFGGNNSAGIAAAVAAVGSSRISYVNTTGWWSTADASDSLHPYGYANLTNLVHRVADEVRAVTTATGGVIVVGGGTFGIVA